MKDPTTVFDEETDSGTPIMPGMYPANLVSLITRAFDSGSTVFNMRFKISDEVKDTSVPQQVKSGGTFQEVRDGSGNPVEVSASFMSGKIFYADGVWFTPSPAKGEGWRNRRYKEAFENLGVSFPREENGSVSLGEIEESDVLGMPAIIKLSESKYTNKNGEEKTAFKAVEIHPWTDGKKLSEAEVASDDKIPF
jgi:hypothetical protein|tara:strand:- start:3141 stop:3722 length:582 start_codon:yes stop_codon:yes gene_type:complete